MEVNDRIRDSVNGGLDILHRRRRLVSLLLYGLIASLSYLLAFFLRFELSWPTVYSESFWLTLPVLLVLRVSLARVLRLSTSRWRFIGTQDFLRLLAATSIGSLFFFILSWELGFPASVPRSVILLEWILTTYGTAGMWIAYRVIFQHVRKVDAKNGEKDRRVLLVGAGEAGAMLVREMARYPTGCRVVGMLDDDPMKQGTSIQGVTVLGPIEDIKEIAEDQGADEIVIAIPSATPAELSRIVELCEGTDLSFKLLPGIEEVLAGTASMNQLRPVRIEDLLGREPINLELPELAEELRGTCLLVTGAAGSIGSELSRQIALHNPDKLLLLDQAETPLVELDLELREEFPDLEIVPIVGDVTDTSSVARLFEEHAPDQVFHAAAYKHVPMMEVNAEEAVKNNVVGTLNVAKSAGESACQKFVLVSTDKAVEPANVMGATKRLAEQVVLECQDRYPDTSFAAVRFGNVLGSNGSVIPLFRKQIEEGKPLTVTHPEVTRYFMTIPEAVQLILQASLLPGIRGQIAMLEMGESVRILNLAKKMLRFAGIPASEGRNIVFTGLRPGEKLHERLVAPGEETIPTSIERVRIVASRQFPDAEGLGQVLFSPFGDGSPSRSQVKEVLEVLASSTWYPDVLESAMPQEARPLKEGV